MKLQIKLRGAESIIDFVNVASSFESDVNIYSGHNVFDAKSIVALFAIGTSLKTYVEIQTLDKKELEEFQRAMRKFRPLSIPTIWKARCVKSDQKGLFTEGKTYGSCNGVVTMDNEESSNVYESFADFKSHNTSKWELISEEVEV